jgi:hypothetical protein
MYVGTSRAKVAQNVRSEKRGCHLGVWLLSARKRTSSKCSARKKKAANSAAESWRTCVARRPDQPSQNAWRTPNIKPVWDIPAPTVPPALTDVADVPWFLTRPAIAYTAVRLLRE